MTATKQKLEKLKPEAHYREVIAERVAVLVDTFGENDVRVRQVKDRLLELCQPPNATDSNWAIAAMYVTWATKNPGDITKEPTYECTCGPTKGWVVEKDESGRIASLRPCSRCNQETFSWLYEKGNITPDSAPVRRSTVSTEEEPPLEEPMWDDL